MSLSSLTTALVLGVFSWVPTDVTQFWITPNETAVLHFDADEKPDKENVKYEIRTTDGDLFLAGESKVEGKSFKTSVTLPQGYFELTLPETNQTFGVACQTSFDSGAASERDLFFAIDSASTWLVKSDGAREDLIKNARRMGLATYRERLNWARIEKEEGLFDFEGDNRSETLRKLAETNDMPILELFHNAPDWTGHIGKFPEDLIKTADSWGVIGKRWERFWNSLEVWNEPDILFSGNLPADQYVPVLKTVASEFSRLGVETPIVGGIIASFRDDYMDSFAENGGLDVCDYFSFHTYCRAYDMETVSLRYLRWLEKNMAEWKPTWITECGRPWKKGTSRPNRESDLASAIDIVQKGVVAKALGIDAYFPFVFPYYEENDNNFGMCDFNNAPLRSSAGYSRLVALLSNKRCLGSLVLPNAATERSYLFIDDETNEEIVVLYARERSVGRRVVLPFKPLFVERVTGEKLEISEDGSADFSDGFLFVGLPKDCQVEIAKATEVDSVRNLRRSARVKRGVNPRSNHSIILRYDFDESIVRVGNDGYRILDSSVDTFSGTLSVFNLDTHDKTLAFSLNVAVEDDNGELTFTNADSSIPETVVVPKRGRVTVPFSLATSILSPFGESKLIFHAGEDVLSFKVSRGVDEASFRKYSTLVCKLDVNDLNRWQKNSSGNGQMEYIDGLVMSENPEEHGWGFTAKFSDKLDRWAYPIFTLPFIENSNRLVLLDSDGNVTERALSEFKGIAFRIKGTSTSAESALRFFTYNDRGNYFFTSVPIALADGQEHFIAFSFASLIQYGGGNERFDANQVRAFSFGCNSNGDETRVQVGDVFLFR